MKRKLLELGNKQSTARTLGEDKSPEGKQKKSVRFRRGEKVFRLTEVREDDSSSHSDDEISEELETILALKDDDKRNKFKKKN